MIIRSAFVCYLCIIVLQVPIGDAYAPARFRWTSDSTAGMHFPSSTKIDAEKEIAMRVTAANSVCRFPLRMAASSSHYHPSDEDGHRHPETSLRRMRRRKVNIYKQKRAYGTSYLLILWYCLSIGFNLFSKQALNTAPSLAWTAATLQMAGGLSYAFFMWWSKKRQTPHLSKTDISRLIPVSLLHSLVHIGGVVSMGAGAVSFTYIVKASEPAVSAALGIFTGAALPFSVFLTLFPIMGGVALASVSELSFNWKSFNYAMLSNLASASRGVVGKKTINKRLGKNMTPINLYAVLTIMSSICLIPLALLIEGPVLKSSLQALRASNQLVSWLMNNFLASMFYYTYNEVAFLALNNLSSVSHAIANTVKRIFIIASSMIVFGNKMTLKGLAGSVLAIGGVLLYSLEKGKHAKIKPKSN